MRFRVLQFNMQYGQGWDDVAPDNAPVNLDRTVAEIRRHSPDLIFLQEVEHAQPGGLQLNPPPNFTFLQSELKEYASCFGYPKPDPRELPFGIGLAVFSRWHLRDVHRIDLRSPPISFNFNGHTTTPTDRLLLSAKTTVQGHELQLLNTHLLAFFMLGSSSVDNPEQRQIVGDFLAKAKGPTLLAGDFNIRRHGMLVTEYKGYDFSTVQDREITWRRMPFILDHIFHNRGLRCVGHQVVPTLASDHHALVADFEFA